MVDAVLDDLLQKATSQELPAALQAGPPRLMRPYDVPSPDAPERLNAVSGPDLFALPPLLGYGAAFATMAEAFKHTRLHAFDFIEAEDRLERYRDAITAISGDQPIRLIGLSGGALLAFEVAKSLEAAGHRVADLILLDTPANLAPVGRSDEDVDAKIQADLAHLHDRMISEGGQYGRAARNAEAHQALVAKMRAFITYLDPLVTEGAIAADIHQIRSIQHWDTEAAWHRWSELTIGQYLTYRGLGNHADMLDQASGPANAAIIEDILRGSGDGSVAFDAASSGAGQSLAERV